MWRTPFCSHILNLKFLNQAWIPVWLLCFWQVTKSSKWALCTGFRFWKATTCFPAGNAARTCAQGFPAWSVTYPPRWTWYYLWYIGVRLMYVIYGSWTLNATKARCWVWNCFLSDWRAVWSRNHNPAKDLRSHSSSRGRLLQPTVYAMTQSAMQCIL